MRVRLSTLNMTLLIIATMLIGVAMGMNFRKPVTVPEQNGLAPENGLFSVGMTILAVDDKGGGVATDLTVETKPGNGKVLANIDQLLFFVDTQQSIQVAREVAINYTGLNPRRTDLMYNIDTPSNVSLVGGPSAGAAMTIATIAALKHEAPRSDAAITGSISPDGSIGQVGGVYEKAKAAKARGISLLLVPSGEGTETSVVPVETCDQKTGYVYCETTYNRTIINIGSSLGMDVREVSDIREAASLFGL